MSAATASASRAVRSRIVSPSMPHRSMQPRVPLSNLRSHARHSRLPRQQPPRCAGRRRSARHHALPSAASPRSRPVDPAWPPGRRAAHATGQPRPVRQLLGQALALSAALASALKFSGSFSVQAKGDGPISLLLTDCTDRGALRGYARVNAERFADTLAAHAEPDAATLLGAGYLAFTVDQGPIATAIRASSPSRAPPLPTWRCTTLLRRSSSAAGSAGSRGNPRRMARLGIDPGEDRRCRRH